MGEERLADEESAHDKEDVNTMREWDVGKRIENGLVKKSSSMTSANGIDGKSPQQVQAKDTLVVDIDAKEILQFIECKLL